MAKHMVCNIFLVFFNSPSELTFWIAYVYTLPAFLTHATFATLIKKHNMYLVYPSSALISELSIIIQIISVGKEVRIYILTRYIFEN